ncbi:MAG: ABC transporter substrate-binding protein [Dehalococcoidia bacterium]|nr:ABC transporter substrate-binding protein [Dehalococcoidia bacterium]
MKQVVLHKLALLALGGLAALALLTSACGDDDDDDDGGDAPAEEATEEATEAETEAEATEAEDVEATEGEAPTEEEEEAGAGEPAALGECPPEGMFAVDESIALFDERPADEDRTGVSDDAIRIGKHSPLTGPAAAINAGEYVSLFLHYVNANGGIFGRQIELVEADSAFNPAQGVTAVQQLVERDQVFALMGGQGSAIETAVSDYLISRGIPNLFPAAAAVQIAEPTEPTRFSGILSGIQTGLALADYIVSQQPGASLAIIHQNDEFGRSILPAFEVAAEEGELEIVATPTFDLGQPDLTPQVQQAVDADPDFILIEAQAPQGLQMLDALRETIGSELSVIFGSGFPGIPPGSPHVDGVISVLYNYAPTQTDLGCTQQVKEMAEEAGLQFNSLAMLGAQWVDFLVRSLTFAGPDPTREGLIEAMETGFDGSWACGVCVGPTTFGPHDHWKLETLLPVEWDEEVGGPVPIGDPVSYETSEGRGIRGNIPGYECMPETCPWED